MANIENLKKEVDDIKNSLNELKNNVSLSEVEKKKKAETLNAQAETTKQKIQDEIHSLETKTDYESKKKKEEAEILLNSFSEIMNLYTFILNSTEKDEESVETEKGFFGKVGDWLGEQWNDVTSGEKWKEEPGKNILRVAGVGLTGYAIYKGVKSLWNRVFGDDKKEQEQKEKKSKEGESFLKMGWGKLLKWAGITTATGGGIYGISKLFSSKKESVEISQEGGDTISDAMFKHLLNMEGNQDFVAKIHKQEFGENFVTGPYGI